MRFTTASGTTYELTEIADDGGVTRGAYLIRDGVPLIDIADGSEMSELHAQRVVFVKYPAVGESFVYVSQSHGTCHSTPVTVITEEAA